MVSGSSSAWLSRPKRFARWLVPLLLAALLAACQFAPVPDEASPHLRLAPGDTIVLHEPLSVPPGHARVFLQQGRVRAKHRLDSYRAHCNFELATVSDVAQTIHPGRFTITDVRWWEESVVQRDAPRLVRVGSDSESATLITRLLHHQLEAPQQAGLRRLTCHGGFSDPWQVQFPSVAQIREALGTLASVERQ